MNIQNPETGKKISVIPFQVNPREILMEVKKGSGAREISCMLLSQKSPEKAMVKSLYGDCANNNFAIRIFEEALDWTLGLKVLQIIQATIKTYKKIPKPFILFLSRKGDIFLQYISGKIVKI